MRSSENKNQFWKLQKKKKNAKPVTKIKVIKIHRYTKIPKIKKSLVVKKKKSLIVRPRSKEKYILESQLPSRNKKTRAK